MIKNKLSETLQYNNKESPLYMPNEVFDDLKSVIKRGEHISFAYSFYYLISWLYRYTKYGIVPIDMKMIKQMLGYNEKAKSIDFIIKKDGILDQLDYTYSSTDYPIAWKFDDGFIEFTMLSDLDDETRKYVSKGNSRNNKIKVSVKGLYRDKESEEEEYLNGTFYDISNTHLMQFEVFEKCMSNNELGCIGFYLYGYMRNKCQIFGKYNCSYDRIAEGCGLSANTVEKYINVLNREGLIKYDEGECKYVEKEFKKQAHTYYLSG